MFCATEMNSSNVTLKYINNIYGVLHALKLYTLIIGFILKEDISFTHSLH